MPVSARELFDWHARPGAFERLTPPFDRARVVARSGGPGIAQGSTVTLRVGAGPFSMRWVARHEAVEDGRSFRDVQERGPFRLWRHTHRFERRDEGSVLEDDVEYALPLGALGRLLGGRAVRRKLERMFAYRHRVTRDDLALHARAASPPMRILVTGSTGGVGSALVPLLTTGGHEVVRLRHGTRASAERPAPAGPLDPASGVLAWQPEEDHIDLHPGDRFDAVVHLAGENILALRYTEAKKQRILESRVRSTELLAKTLAAHPHPPHTLVCASAVGYYGDRGDEELTETSDSGGGFLAGVCRAWEAASRPAEEAGIRVVRLRIGVVMDPRAGALRAMLPAFRLGLGARLGSGRQWMSWISIDDLIAAIHRALTDPSLRGTVNATAPTPVTNREFTRTLAGVLRRPALLAAPAFALRLAAGTVADEMLLASTRVMPDRLVRAGHRFRHETFEDALRHLLGR